MSVIEDFCEEKKNVITVVASVNKVLVCYICNR